MHEQNTFRPKTPDDAKPVISLTLKAETLIGERAEQYHKASLDKRISLQTLARLERRASHLLDILELAASLESEVA